jgi:hypothetical protein
MASLGRIERMRCQNAECAHGFEKWVVSDRTEPVLCPECAATALPARLQETAKHPGMDYDQPVLSDSMGCAPSQVAEHRRLYPNVPILDDGRVVVRNHYEYKKIRKTLGMVDRDSRYI